MPMSDEDRERLEENGMATDIHVERRRNHDREFSIFDRFGGAGNISLTEGEAEYVRDRITEELDDGG